MKVIFINGIGWSIDPAKNDHDLVKLKEEIGITEGNLHLFHHHHNVSLPQENIESVKLSANKFLEETGTSLISTVKPVYVFSIDDY